MFDEELIYSLCELYGIEIKQDGEKSTIIDEDGIERELTEQDINDIFNKKDKINK